MARDKETFCQQIRLHQQAVYAMALLMVKHREDAADIVQESILRAYSRWDSLRDESSFRPWLLAIAHHAAIDHLRARQPLLPLDEAAQLAASEPSLDAAARLTVREAVEQLQLPYRTVIHLFYYEDCTVEEIARITGASPAAVRQQLSRGRRLLAQMLKREELVP